VTRCLTMQSTLSAPLSLSRSVSCLCAPAAEIAVPETETAERGATNGQRSSRIGGPEEASGRKDPLKQENLHWNHQPCEVV